MPEPAERVDRMAAVDSVEVQKRCTSLDESMAELRALYENFFLGIDRVPPTKPHERVKKELAALRGTFVRQTAMKFRIQNLAQKLVTYERLWERTLQEIEAGTYSRDLFKARRHLKERLAKGKEQSSSNAPPASTKAHEPEPEPDFHVEEDLEVSELEEEAPHEVPRAAPPRRAQPFVVPGITPVLPRPVSVTQPTPAPGKSAPTQAAKVPAVKIPSVAPVAKPALKPPPIVSSAASALKTPTGASGSTPPPSGGLTEQKIRAVFDAYVMAKKRCGEDTRSVTLDSVSNTLRNQVPQLLRQYKAKTVEFRVVIKDGRAVLRAVPKP